MHATHTHTCTHTHTGAIAQCSAHLINEGVVISGNSVTVEFTVTGLANLASSICILGSQVVDPCKLHMP